MKLVNKIKRNVVKNKKTKESVYHFNAVSANHFISMFMNLMEIKSVKTAINLLALTVN